MIWGMKIIHYTKYYLLSADDDSCDDLSYETSLHSIASYLQNNDNYKIYHSMNDYLINSHQLKKLKEYANDKLVLFDNGAHLGFLYRHEFIEDLKNEESLNMQVERNPILEGRNVVAILAPSSQKG